MHWLSQNLQISKIKRSIKNVLLLYFPEIIKAVLVLSKYTTFIS